jgi:Fur family transcriptional regulator, peroxide stress response regulator
VKDLAAFRKLCFQHGLAATYQRQVIYETVMSLPGHPSTESIYEKVKKRIPSISLATVYKNIHVFLQSGVFHEVSLHHGSLRVETNPQPHHHLVCMRCKAIVDVDEADMEPLRLKHQPLRGFQVRRFAVDVLGICESCGQKKANQKAQK